MMRRSDALARRLRTRTSSGFTLLEVMIAMMVLSFGLLGMGLMQITALREGTKGHHSSTALAIARDQYEQMLRMPFSSANLNVTGWANPPWIPAAAPLQAGDVAVTATDGAGGTATEMVYRVWIRITADAGLPPAAPNADLRQVDIEVRWDEVNGRSNKKIAFNGMIVNNDR